MNVEEASNAGLFGKCTKQPNGDFVFFDEFRITAEKAKKLPNVVVPPGATMNLTENLLCTKLTIEVGAKLVTHSNKIYCIDRIWCDGTLVIESPDAGGGGGIRIGHA